MDLFVNENPQRQKVVGGNGRLFPYFRRVAALQCRGGQMCEVCNLSFVKSTMCRS
jgi:hypothetical protein